MKRARITAWVAGALALGVAVFLLASPGSRTPEADADGAELSVPAVPSGQPVALQDIRPEADGTRLRFRFVAEQIDERDFETTAEDMHHLCETYALPWMTREAASADEIVISVAAREVPFGDTVPEVTQYFEAYRVEDGACVWELFR